MNGIRTISDERFEWIAHDLCENALEDARKQLHPLVRGYALDRLDKRSEFGQAFKLALEQRIASIIALWLPGVQAIFCFDESWMESRATWDGSVHLLIKVSQLSNAIQLFGNRLDACLLKCLKGSGWSRFQGKHSILEIQQVTPNELRHAIGYGAMFCAVYSVPIRIWSRGIRVHRF